MVVHGPFPPDPRVEREVRVACDRGYDVDLVALREPGQSAFEIVDGASVFRLPIEHRRTGSLLRLIVEYVSFTVLATAKVGLLDRRRRYAVVHVHNPPDFLALAAILPKIRGAKVIFDVHDLASDMFAMRFGHRALARGFKRLFLAVERAAAGLADVVLTVHEPYRRELMARGTPAEKLVVVMNSLDPNVVSSMKGERPDHGFRVVYHGTVTPHYGVDLLVEAIALARPKVPELTAHVYGTGDALGRAQDRARELGASDVIEFSGRYVPHREVLRSVSSASVGVVPNLPIRLNRFALSSKLMEYVALGVPAVCADLPTLRAHFTDNEVRFFTAGDANALAEAIVDVARDPEAAARRSANALRRYDAQYRWQRSAERYAAILDEWRPT